MFIVGRFSFFYRIVFPTKIKHFTLTLILIAFLVPSAHAWENKPEDDKVMFNLSVEDWVTTKTARVVINVDVVSPRNAREAQCRGVAILDAHIAAD